MRHDFLPFSQPAIGDDEIREVVETLRSNWLTTGPKTRDFERLFAEYLDTPEALALNSCTAGLHTALITLGIGAGDEVITTPMTFAASVNVIEHVGARPVLVDVEPDTMNICPDATAAAVTSKTRAIIPVHLAGHPVNMDAMMSIAEQHKLHIIEDAAHAISAKYKGQMIGSMGNPTAFSFYATKNITTGEGGMLTGDSDFLAKARILSLHGMSREAWTRYVKDGGWMYDVVSPGFKYNMTDIQSSIGLWQLKKIEAMQQRRLRIVEQYDEAFRNIDGIKLPVERPDVEHAWHLYVIRVDEDIVSIDRDQFVKELYARNIGTSVHFIPIHLHSYYRNKYDFRPMDFPVAFNSFQQILSLPLTPTMNDQDVADVIEAVTDITRGQQVRRIAA
jgi:dTDP-4-amino-4,6-dideoxygalactose transaminase